MINYAPFCIAAIDVCSVLILGVSHPISVCYCSHKASSPSAAAFNQPMLYKPWTKEFPYPDPVPLYHRGGKERTKLIHLKNKNPSRGCCCWLTCEGNEMCTPGVSRSGQGGRLTLLVYRSDKVSIWWWSLILKQLHSKISVFKLPQQCKWWPGRLIGGYLNLVIFLIFCLKH